MAEEHYQELYKKYRPRVWEDIIGQESIVESLRNNVLNGKIPTGFMFFGPHGCGKTTSAFILAKALNCENLRPDGNPCNECETCKSIDANAQMGVRYISMANQGGVEDVRKLVNEAQLQKPIKHPVYILDESHQLSRAAFDSLLIPLESEQMKTLFIFCSTEPNKIPKTILSRIQVRNFSPVEGKVLARNLMKIVQAESLEVTKEQIIQAVRAANGSVRDSISFLETLSAQGTLPEQYSEQVLKLITTNKYTDIFKLTETLNQEGQNFTDITQQLYSDLSKVLIILSGASIDTVYSGMNTAAKSLTPREVMAYLNVLGDTINRMATNTVDSRILFEIAMSKIVGAHRKKGETK